MTTQVLFNPFMTIFRVLAYAWSLLKSIDRCYWVLLAMPFVLLLLYPGWIISSVLQGTIDPWIYLGYMLNWKCHWQAFPHTYYGARIPWISVGILVYELFPSYVAMYLLPLLVYYTGVFSLYVTIKRLFGRKAALLTSTLLGSYFYFLYSVGSTHYDGLASVLLLVVLCFLTPTSCGYKNRVMTYLNLACAGFAFATAVATQMFLLNYVPLVLLYFSFITASKMKTHYLKSVCFLLFGFAIAVLFWCIVAFFINGTFFFFMDSISICQNILFSPTNPWWHPLHVWTYYAQHWKLPAMAFAGSFLAIIIYLRGRASNNIASLSAYCLLSISIHAVWQFVFKLPILEMYYYASYLIPGIFLWIGALLGPVAKNLKRRSFIIVYATLICWILVVYTYLGPKNPIHYWLSLKVISAVVTICFALLLVFYKGRLLEIFSDRQPAMKCLAITALIMSSSSGIFKHSSAYFLTPIEQKNAFLTVIDSVSHIRQAAPEADLLFWFDSRERLQYVFRSISSCYLWGYRLVNEDFPLHLNPSSPYKRELFSGDRVLILSEDTPLIEQANQSLLESSGLQGSVVSQKLMESGSVRYYLTVLELSPAQ